MHVKHANTLHVPVSLTMSGTNQIRLKCPFDLHISNTGIATKVCTWLLCFVSLDNKGGPFNSHRLVLTPVRMSNNTLSCLRLNYLSISKFRCNFIAYFKVTCETRKYCPRTNFTNNVSHKSNSVKISVCSYISNTGIATKVCTWHDNRTNVA